MCWGVYFRFVNLMAYQPCGGDQRFQTLYKCISSKVKLTVRQECEIGFFEAAVQLLSNYKGVKSYICIYIYIYIYTERERKRERECLPCP